MLRLAWGQKNKTLFHVQGSSRHLKVWGQIWLLSELLITYLTLMTLSVLAEEYHLHNMMLPSPCSTVGILVSLEVLRVWLREQFIFQSCDPEGSAWVLRIMTDSFTGF
ncbi:hypothetical protein CHARACLAT_020694 [Characodon lateralis]|uniref:Uncharacterized protein n=1 Tax=Characodon lateralis TaxID=208331 RepID=A0ABU7D9D5_9TELE|nr:hypothetical protein [Characodon lateralis]